MSHAHITSTRGYLDGKLVIDGARFPYPIHSIRYRLDGKTAFPRITVEFEVDHLTVDHSYKYEPDTEAQTEADA